MNNKFIQIYENLLNEYGNQNWWPIHENTDPFEEITIGAILTQNTSWKNVEKSIQNLIENNLLSFEKLDKVDIEVLKKLIKPSGFYNQKAKTIKETIKTLKNIPRNKIDRETLLSIKGIGRETADCILLYGLNKPFFVVDAYTKRIFSRAGLINQNMKYDKIQKKFIENLPKDIQIYKEYHALIVEHGKRICLKRNPNCKECSISYICIKIF